MSSSTRRNKRTRESADAADVEEQRRPKLLKLKGRDQPDAAAPLPLTPVKGQQAQPSTGQDVLQLRSPTAGSLVSKLRVWKMKIKKSFKIGKKRGPRKNVGPAEHERNVMQADVVPKAVSPLLHDATSFLGNLEETLEIALDDQIDLREIFQMAVVACTMADVIQPPLPGKQYGYVVLQRALQRFSDANNPFTSIEKELTDFCNQFLNPIDNTRNDEKHLIKHQVVMTDIVGSSLLTAAVSGIIALNFAAPFVGLALGSGAIKILLEAWSSLSEKLKAERTRLKNIATDLEDLLQEGKQMHQDIHQRSAKDDFGTIQNMGKELLSNVDEALQKEDGHVHVNKIDRFRREHRQFTTKLKILVMHARESCDKMEKTANHVLLQMNADQATDTSSNEGSGAIATKIKEAVPEFTDTVVAFIE